MIYVVFAEFNRVTNPTSDEYGKIPDPACYYLGRDKSAALDVFHRNTDIVFSIACPYNGGTLHFTIFDNELPFFQNFDFSKDITVTDINAIKNRLTAALSDNTLTYTITKTKPANEVCQCEHCGSTKKSLHKTAYDTWICGSCWDDSWLRSPAGRVEYVISLAKGDYSLSAFSLTDQVNMVSAWKTFETMGIKSETEIAAIRLAAVNAGLDFTLTEDDLK